MSELEKTADAAPTRRDWHDIEPLLKWGAVAYVFGFGIVLVHTYRLGVPMLQLMEPVNVWIGLPLAVVVYFLDKIYSAVRASMRTTMDSLRNRDRIREQLQASLDERQFLSQVTDIWIKALALFAAPVGLAGLMEQFLHWMTRAGLRMVGKRYGADQPVEPDGSKLNLKIDEEALARVDGMLRRALWIGAVARFLNICLYCFWGLLLCWVYVEMYSVIPQTLGGGKPMAVTLMVSPDAIPKSKEFADWRISNTQPDSEKPEDEKDGFAVPVTLYFRSEHELIVRKGNGPIVSLSDHAVEGIVFDSQ